MDRLFPGSRRVPRGALTALMFAVVFAWAPPSAQTDSVPTRVESTRRVNGPGGQLSAVVDHVMPIYDGEPDRFSGLLDVRVADRDGSETLRKRLETSQVRILQAPVWLDEERFAFVFNITKNANGMACVHVRTGVCYQIELVESSAGVSTRTGASGKVRSLEIVRYRGTSERLHNVVRADQPLFPIFMSQLPDFQNVPYPPEFWDALERAFDAYDDFVSRHDGRVPHIEQASESVSDGVTHLALLACIGRDDTAVVMPLAVADAAAALAATRVVPIGEVGVKLYCGRVLDDEGGEPAGEMFEESDEHLERVRYVTDWQDAQVFDVIKETFETEEGEPTREAVLSVSAEGEVTTSTQRVLPPRAVQQLRAERQPPAIAVDRPAERTADAAPPPAERAVPAAAAAEPERARPAAAASARRFVPEAPAAAPAVFQPPPAPTPTPKPGLVRRLMPFGRSEAPPPPLAIPTPSD